MKCPFCPALDDRVIDSRSSADGSSIRRRRECQSCGRRFTTYERVEDVPRLVVKKDHSREAFARNKVLQGLLKACHKRPVPVTRLEEMVDLVERRLDDDHEYEVPSRRIGELLAEQLREVDQVAYVRFASVYQEFADVTEFLRELEPLLERSGLSAVDPPGVRRSVAAAERDEATREDHPSRPAAPGGGAAAGETPAISRSASGRVVPPPRNSGDLPTRATTSAPPCDEGGDS